MGSRALNSSTTQELLICLPLPALLGDVAVDLHAADRVHGRGLGTGTWGFAGAVTGATPICIHV